MKHAGKLIGIFGLFLLILLAYYDGYSVTSTTVTTLTAITVSTVTNTTLDGPLGGQLGMFVVSLIVFVSLAVLFVVIACEIPSKPHQTRSQATEP